MKAPREIKNWINKQRKHRGKKNGVVSWLFESPRIERMLGTNKLISPQPTMPQPETNCPKIDGSKLSAHDQVTRDEFDQEAM